MTASQHDLSLPLRIEEWPVATTSQANIYEANGRLVCSCDAYDAQELVRSVNSFRQLLAACKGLTNSWGRGHEREFAEAHKLALAAIAIAEKETI